jgi:hypothetical protein
MVAVLLIYQLFIAELADALINSFWHIEEIKVSRLDAFYVYQIEETQQYPLAITLRYHRVSFDLFLFEETSYSFVNLVLLEW